MSGNVALTDNRNQSEAPCPLPDTSCPASAYKNGRLTIAGWLITVEDSPKSFQRAFQGRTRQFSQWGRDLLSQWRDADYPELGEWPPEDIGLSLLDYSLGMLSFCLKKRAWPEVEVTVLELSYPVLTKPDGSLCFIDDEGCEQLLPEPQKQFQGRLP